MEAIYIPQLTKAPEKTEVIEVDEFLPDLDTLTPVRGQVRVQHCGNYLDVSAQAETIVTLTCHRCLQQYNHRLKTEISEIIWLDPEAGKEETAIELEVAFEDLVETLSPTGYFDPGEWLYQQLCLAMPQRQLCDNLCQGIQLQQQETSEQSRQSSDRRWSSLESLKNQLSN
jgi:uncharacterized protein